MPTESFVAALLDPQPSLDRFQQVLSKIGAELRVPKDRTPQAVMELVSSADAVLVTISHVTSDHIAQMKRCRIISRLGVGVDSIDVPAATAAGIVVTRVPDASVNEVSDHAMALLLASARKVTVAHARVQAGRWEVRALAPIHRLRGTVLGLVGFGHIPQLVAPKAQAFGMQVVAYDPYVPPETMSRAGVKRVEFMELLQMSDYVSIHTPLSEETRHLFNAQAFRYMKPTAYLINTSRGPVVDEAALAAALDNQQLAGAALDVLEKEPPSGSPLLGRENVTLTPHSAFYSEESVAEQQTKGTEEVVAVLSGKAPRNPVNPEAMQVWREKTASRGGSA